jgi:NAD(P)H-dependent FMN reductase
MPLTVRFSSLKRFGPSPSNTMMRTLHLSPTRASMERAIRQSSLAASRSLIATYVPQYQVCAFLRSVLHGTTIASVTVLYHVKRSQQRHYMTVISIIVGSTREGRFSEKPAHWIFQHLKKRGGVEARLLDLRDFAMPFFDQPVPPAMPGRSPYSNEIVQKWTAEIARSDGFIFVAPEYNYGPSAVLKNALDWVYPEWNRKAAAFVSYGSVGGARGVQQLRLTAIELQLAPIRSSVHVPVATLWAHFQGGDVAAGLAELDGPANAMIDDLLWWSTALKKARTTAS